MYDLVIKNGLIVDGTGADGYLADVGITNDTIIHLGKIDVGEAKNIIDADGYFSPFFFFFFFIALSDPSFLA